MDAVKNVSQQISEYLKGDYTISPINKIPTKSDFDLSNTVKVLESVTTFYVDMRKSSKILTDSTDFWSLKIHKTFLKAVTSSVVSHGGEIRSFNGDGILAFFLGESAATDAVAAGMQLKALVQEINQILSSQNIKEIDFGVGVSQGRVIITKCGVEDENNSSQDLIWVGLPVYEALELSELSHFPINIHVSNKVKDALDHDEAYKDQSKDDFWHQIETVLKNGKSIAFYTSELCL